MPLIIDKKALIDKTNTTETYLVEAHDDGVAPFFADFDHGLGIFPKWVEVMPAINYDNLPVGYDQFFISAVLQNNNGKLKFKQGSISPTSICLGIYKTMQTKKAYCIVRLGK